MNWRCHIVFAGLLFVAGMGFSQKTSTFYGDVWPIVQKKCTPCHREGGSAPFPLEQVEDFQARSRFIDHVVSTGYMPPWPPASPHGHFKNEKRLTPEELETLTTWLGGEMETGTKSSGFEVALQTGFPSRKGILLKPKRSFEVQASGKDNFVYFLLEDQIKKDLHITDFRFHPGNKDVVHHMELLALPPGAIGFTDALTVSDTNYFGSGFDSLFGRNYTYLSGWLPGNQGEHFPQGSGFTLEQGSRLVLMVHYAPSPVKEKDWSKVELFCQNSPPATKVESIDLHTPEYLRLPAGTVQSFTQEHVLERDFHAFAIFPHAHHLCTKIEAFVISPQADTLPLLVIPAWDFDWQFTYYLRDYVHLPAGSKVVFTAVYNNTASNPENPFSPPRDAMASFRSTDEMMELFLWGFYGETGGLPPLDQ